jgi:hypothetical protein
MPEIGRRAFSRSSEERHEMALKPRQNTLRQVDPKLFVPYTRLLRLVPRKSP